MEQGELIPKAAMLAAIVSGKGEAMARGQTVPVMIRCPIWTLAKIDALAKQSGKSRSGMVNLLCDVGIEAVLEQLSPEVAEQVVTLESEAYSLLTKDDPSEVY